MQYLINILITLDQFLNVLFGGHPDETMSASLWRHREKSACWCFGYMMINTIFFWQKDHCLESYLSEVQRKQLPKQYQ